MMMEDQEQQDGITTTNQLKHKKQKSSILRNRKLNLKVLMLLIGLILKKNIITF
jgi:hypothetical protein